MLGSIIGALIGFVLGLIGGIVITPYFRPLSERLEKRARKRWDREVERFHIWVSVREDAEAMWHEWRLVLDLIVEGERYEWPIPKDAPFVTVSPGRLPYSEQLV